METTKFIIVDKTANTGKYYIDKNGDNCSLIENAATYDTEKEAEETIKNNGWEKWATTLQSWFVVDENN
jgi:hypothetical protein